MKVAAIIAEYNPLHKGHTYHINSTKEISECDAVICIMSGNFVQRGEPAIIDKWMRTKMALKNGADLVNGSVQYPFSFPSGISLDTATLNYDKLGRSTATDLTLSKGAVSVDIKISGSGYAR